MKSVNLSLLVLVLITSLNSTIARAGFSWSSDATCVTKATEQLGLNAITETDPALLKNILEKQMFLGDFNEFKDRIQLALTNPVPLKDFMTSIQEGLVRNHPAVVRFACQAVQLGLFSPAAVEKNKIQIKRIVHHTYLLERLTQEMMKDPQFTIAVRDHYNGMRVKEHVDTSRGVYKATNNNAFEMAKMLTASLAFDQYIEFRAKRDLGITDRLFKEGGLMINVTEATALDIADGFENNGFAGGVLFHNDIQEVSTEGPHVDIKQIFTPGWTELYETWNLAFITGNLNDLDILYPKLLIPSLVNASPEDYLYRRGLALWVSANMVLLRKVHYKTYETIGPFPDAAKVWGSINAEYAKAVEEYKDIRCVEHPIECAERKLYRDLNIHFSE